MTFSGTRTAGFYFLAQAVAIGAWWLLLTLDPTRRGLFLPPGAAPLDLLAFALPDLLVAMPASLIAGLAVLSRSRWAALPAWTAAGAVDYAFAYCVACSLLCHGGWLNVVCMAPAALFSTVGALDASPAAMTVFRRALPTTPRRHVVATLAQIVLFWSFFLFIVPAALRFVERELHWPAFVFPLQRAAGIGLFAVCSVLGLASGIVMASLGVGTPLPFASPNRLVVAGPYAYVRNPMVMAGLGQGAAVGLWLGSWTVLAYVLVGGVLWNTVVRPTEERDLQAVFGDEFLAYRARVACWVPRLRPFPHR